MKDSGKRERHHGGAVRDIRVGKGRYDLISVLALRRIAQVYERGAIKYSDRNWEKGMRISRFLDSGLRHICEYIEGRRDEDHLGQAAWNIMAAIHMEEMIKHGNLPSELNDMPDYL